MSKKALVGQEQEVIALYEKGNTPKVIGETFGVTNVTIMNILRREGVKLRSNSESKRKYSVKEDFFDRIDTEEKAYILGLWYADGSNYEETSSITLTLVDFEVVDAVRKVMSPDRPVYERQYGSSPTYSLSISNKRLSQSLASHGCGSRKTFTLRFPTIPDNLIQHFVRGYFDGDGCFHQRKNSNNYVVHILGTKDFLEEMGRHIDLPCSIKKRTNSDIWFYGMYKKDNIRNFAEWLYADATIFMERKRAKIKDLLTSPLAVV